MSGIWQAAGKIPVMNIRKAAKDDCRTIVELALLAGEGIPAYYWEQSRRPGQDILDIGTKKKPLRKIKISPTAMSMSQCWTMQLQECSWHTGFRRHRMPKIPRSCPTLSDR
jgi:hypothetical protein